MASAAKPEPAKATTAAFSAAHLMMPPVRKKAEPVKRPLNPSLDLQKLQQEKEALMRQRASASSQQASSTPAASATAKTSTPSVAGGPAAAEQASAAAAGAGGGAVVASAATSSSAAVSLYGNPDEEYDPAKPNDYDEFCRRRMRMKAEEELERRRQEALAKSAAAKAPEPVQPKEDDFATKMMKKMGWKEGQGLGKDSQGMTTPLIMQKTGTSQGQVVQGGAAKRDVPAPAATSAAKQAKTESTGTPSHVLMLTNMVGAGEVDDELEEETAEEAQKYGKLKCCKIREIKGVPDDLAVRIFLEFEKVEGATKALVDMNGRYFGGRVVKARFYEEAAFARGELELNDW